MERQYLTVTALTKYLRRKFDADPYLERVYLSGEISNYRRRPAHQYFSLKDDRAKISAVMFKDAFSKLKFELKEGMKVLVIGRIALYEASGNYQIYVEHMEPDGIGALYQALAELREKLEKEGLFAAPKKALSRYPKRIAVLTSPSGAVIRDIITTVRRRYPIAQVVLFPTVVQGNQSADDVVRNIQRVEDDGSFDTMIIGRGGGSIEDLWPFNEERVARAIFDAKTPIISSVGHETDTTIADLVADVRAATPTAAAELAVPVLAEELTKIKEKQLRLEQALIKQVRFKEEQYRRLADSYIFRQPARLYESQSMRLDQTKQRFYQVMTNLLHNREKAVQELSYQVLQLSPRDRIKSSQREADYAAEGLMRQMRQYMEHKQQEFATAVQSLDLLSPLKIMGRGYSYTTKTKKVIKSVSEIASGDVLTINYYDGQAEAEVKQVENRKQEQPE